MYIRDVMTTNVVTISSDTSLADARRIMDAHHIRRIPVVDKRKLVGVVNKEALDRAGPSQLTTFSVHELSYLMSKITVKQVMTKDPVTISPDATVEEGVALAQSHKVGALLVVEDGCLIGIATTNDFFYKLLNPILGIGQPGARIAIRKCPDISNIKKALDVMAKLGTGVVNCFTMANPDTGEKDFVFHLTTEDPSALIAELRNHGYEVEQRAR
ncbi:MAG: CBS and ACT domain-containing protein [Chloroflexota bacterium]